MFSCNNDVAEKYLHQGGIKGTYQTVFAKKKKKKANKRGKQYEIKIAAIKKEKKKKRKNLIAYFNKRFKIKVS